MVASTSRDLLPRCGPINAGTFQQVDQASGAGITYLEVPLQHGDRCGVRETITLGSFGEKLVIIVKFSISLLL
jgi:hypothetical protein